MTSAINLVRQELLSGIQAEPQFRKLVEIFESFPDLLAESADHTQAAKFFNTGLICAQAYRNGMAVLTNDGDFRSYGKYIPIKLID